MTIPELVAVASILLTFFLLLWRIAHNVGSMKTSITFNTKSIDRFETRFHRITHNINAMITWVITNLRAPSSIFIMTSPTELGELGIEILDKSGGKNFVDSHLEDLLIRMEEYELKSALDVQNCSSSVILDISDSDDFISLKNFIYQNPKYGKANLSLALISQVMGIYLRDKYFKKYPDLQNVKPIDSAE